MNNNTSLNDPRSLRDAFGSFTTGVTVVTGNMDGKPVGMTVNSFASVSLEPPLISWCIDKKATLFNFFEQADFFSVNVLGLQQQELSELFAKNDKKCFRNINWRKGVNDVPVITGSIASFQCQAEHRYSGGDHIIMVGRVLEFDTNPAEPVVFFGGKYRKLGD